MVPALPWMRMAARSFVFGGWGGTPVNGAVGGGGVFAGEFGVDLEVLSEDDGEDEQAERRQWPTKDGFIIGGFDKERPAVGRNGGPRGFGIGVELRRE